MAVFEAYLFGIQMGRVRFRSESDMFNPWNYTGLDAPEERGKQWDG